MAALCGLFYAYSVYSHLEKRIFMMKIHFKAVSKTCGKSTALLCKMRKYQQDFNITLAIIFQ
ncbi:hypothetical protein HMPREF9096_00371 [Haemophilus sp. oral taxon 851 str. F0397]|nr:hypothetical protein HMPREF9096_00371 [Haemophilus sp. oral taxon 851 str. F0397]